MRQKRLGTEKRGTPTLGKTEKGVLHAIFTQLNDPNSPAHVSGKSPQPGRRGGPVTAPFSWELKKPARDGEVGTLIEGAGTDGTLL